MKWHFSQSQFMVSAENGDLNLGSTKVAGFTVKEKGVTGLKAETSVKELALNERQRRRIKSVVESKALVARVEIRTKIGLGLRGWNSPSISVTIVCGDVTMRQLQNGDPPLCSITLLKWSSRGLLSTILVGSTSNEGKQCFNFPAIILI
ncbi:hypothetical protein D0Y65_015920 [Glycine soja]|uniref:Uncharacterized protein n=1 Tax=Glycine soja TaxID=3848 RepID=A0A445KFE4_GLYSO|nr:hypothetical protein D0Y65_015920 [Glycine soja]